MNFRVWFARDSVAPSRFPVAPVLLIAFGILFLLDNLDTSEDRQIAALLAGGADCAGTVSALRANHGDQT